MSLGAPSCSRLVTPNRAARRPQGAMPEKCDRSGATFSATPWKLTQVAQTHAERRDLVFGGLEAGAKRLVPGRAAAQTPTRSAQTAAGGRPRNLRAWRSPALQRAYEGAHVAPEQAGKIEHHIGHALAGAVIGVLSASPAAMNRKSGIEQISVLRTRNPPYRSAGGISGAGPDLFGRAEPAAMASARASMRATACS